ncbi:hypothetical protein D3C75_1277440 [compost metagenome]
MLPQLAVGGCTPMPRKLRPDSAMIAAATPKVALTMIGASAFGRMWRKTIRGVLSPRATPALM